VLVLDEGVVRSRKKKEEMKNEMTDLYTHLLIHTHLGSFSACQLASSSYKP